MANLQTRMAEVQDALHAALLVSGASLEKGAVTLGWPKGGRHKRQIWIDEEVRVTTAYRQSTGASRQETIEFDVKCTQEVTGNEYKPVRDKVLELVHMVEAAAGADLTLGGIASLVTVSQIRLDAAFIEEKTRFAGATVTVAVDVTVTAT